VLHIKLLSTGLVQQIPELKRTLRELIKRFFSLSYMADLPLLLKHTLVRPAEPILFLPHRLADDECSAIARNGSGPRRLIGQHIDGLGGPPQPDCTHRSPSRHHRSRPGELDHAGPQTGAYLRDSRGPTVVAERDRNAGPLSSTLSLPTLCLRDPAATGLGAAYRTPGSDRGDECNALS
jgi:hypothetical protein